MIKLLCNKCNGRASSSQINNLTGSNAAFKRGQRLAGKPLDTGAKIAFGKKYSG